MGNEFLQLCIILLKAINCKIPVMPLKARSCHADHAIHDYMTWFKILYKHTLHWDYEYIYF